MSVQAKNIKRGDCLVLDDYQVYQVLDVHEVTKGNHVVKLSLQNFSNSHKTQQTFGLDVNVRKVEPSHTNYLLTHLNDHADNGNLYLSLLNPNTTKTLDNIYVRNLNAIKYLKDYFSASSDPLEVTVTTIEVPAMHHQSKSESDLSFVRVTSIQGFDMNHYHDKNHSHHHVHVAH